MLGDAVLSESAKQQLDDYSYGYEKLETTRNTFVYAHSRDSATRLMNTYGQRMLTDAEWTATRGTAPSRNSAIDHYAYLYRFPHEQVVVVLLASSSEQVARDTMRGALSLLFPEN
jgi:hypothetical protein